MTRPHVGWYVHHHGRGHAHRARSVVEVLQRRGIDVTVLSSLPDEGWAPWLVLPRDDEGGEHDPTAGGALHWAPTDSAGYRDRMARVAAWARTADASVVDVSVELTVLLRTLGVPTVTLAMPGNRPDRPHALGYDIATQVVAAWPAGLGDPDHVTRRTPKVTHVGGISRYEGRTAPTAEEIAALRPADGRRHVVVVGGAGGSSLTPADLDAARAATPAWSWTAAGRLGRWFDDMWPLLHSADVVVSAAGQGSIADLAAAGSRAIVIPEDRPFDEQAATARLLVDAGLAVGQPSWPSPDAWPELLDEASHLENRWHTWQVVGAATRFADVVERIAREAHERGRA